MWNVETFVEEVGAVRDALALDRTHVFGSSWGGMLAMEYALTQPRGVASLTISSSPASIPLWAEETGRLRSELPPGVRRVLDEHEAAETTDSPEYQEAMMEFYKRHVCRLDPLPDGVARSFAELEENPGVYLYMQGPNEFVITGTFKDWDITGRLGEIRRADARHVRPARRVHAQAGGDRAPRHRWLGMGRLRGQLAHAVLRGARALPRGARRLPDARRSAASSCR